MEDVDCLGGEFTYVSEGGGRREGEGSTIHLPPGSGKVYLTGVG